MRKTRTKVSKEVKEQILLKSSKEGCNISLLAKEYKLSTKTIHKWRNEYRKNNSELKQVGGHFVELTAPTPVISCSLKKVELTFDDYTCAIEGRIGSKQLLKLVQLLEGKLC